MKLLIASDLHGSVPATEMLLDIYQRSDATHMILLGDLLNHGPRNPIPAGYHPAEVARLLNSVASQIIAVRGNCDSEVDQMLLDFPMMSDYAWVLLECGQRLFLTHGHLYHQASLPPLADGDVLVHGHTHVPVAQECGCYSLFNPGSMTFPKENHPPSYGFYADGKLTVLDFHGTCLRELLLADKTGETIF